MTDRLASILSCLQGNYEAWALRRFQASWYCAERRERKARLQAIVELSVELVDDRQARVVALGGVDDFRANQPREMRELAACFWQLLQRDQVVVIDLPADLLELRGDLRRELPALCE